MGVSWGLGGAPDIPGYASREYSPPSAQAPSDSGSIPGCSQTNLQNRGEIVRSPWSPSRHEQGSCRALPAPPRQEIYGSSLPPPLATRSCRRCGRCPCPAGSAGREELCRTGGAAEPRAGRQQSPGTAGWGPPACPAGAQTPLQHPLPQGTRDEGSTGDETPFWGAHGVKDRGTEGPSQRQQRPECRAQAAPPACRTQCG